MRRMPPPFPRPPLPQLRRRRACRGSLSRYAEHAAQSCADSAGPCMLNFPPGKALQGSVSGKRLPGPAAGTGRARLLRVFRAGFSHGRKKPGTDAEKVFLPDTVCAEAEGAAGKKKAPQSGAEKRRFSPAWPSVLSWKRYVLSDRPGRNDGSFRVPRR